MRILVLDDDPLICCTIAGYLEDVVEVDVASSTDQALALDPSSYSALLVDIILPGENGAQFIQRLRQDGCSARIIAMSGGSREISGLQALSVAKVRGAEAVLFKPFGRERLLRSLFGNNGQA